MLTAKPAKPPSHGGRKPPLATRLSLCGDRGVRLRSSLGHGRFSKRQDLESKFARDVPDKPCQRDHEHQADKQTGLFTDGQPKPHFRLNIRQNQDGELAQHNDAWCEDARNLLGDPKDDALLLAAMLASGSNSLALSERVAMRSVSDRFDRMSRPGRHMHRLMCRLVEDVAEQSITSG